MTSLSDALEAIGVPAAEVRTLTIGRAEIPYFIIADGERAAMCWHAMRARANDTGHWPVVLGSPDDLATMLRLRSETGMVDAASTLAEAKRTNPDPLEWARRRAERDRRALHDKGHHWLCSRSTCEHGDWPEGAPSPEVDDGATLPEGIKPQSAVTMGYSCKARHDGEGVRYRPLERVAIALIPTSRPWEAAAYLMFGWFNACPAPHEHVSLHHHWFLSFGAVIFGMKFDELEFVVDRPPLDRERALAVARVHGSYAPDEWQYHSLGATAARLVGATVWHFWWE